MKKAYFFLKKNFRSLFYALTISLGIELGIQILYDKGLKFYIYSNSLFFFVLIFEVYQSWRSSTKIFRQIDLPINSPYSLNSNIFKHLILPLLLFLSITLFEYFNTDQVIRFIAGFLSFIQFFLVFINIRSYYEDNFVTESSTNYIYGLIELSIFFFLSNAIMNFGIQFNIAKIFIAGLISILVLLEGVIQLFLSSISDILTLLYFLICSLIIFLTFLLLLNLGFAYLSINIIILLEFYISISLFIHKLNRSLTKDLIIEYTLILVIAFLILKNI